MEAVERKGRLPPHNGRTGDRERHTEDDHDQRILPEGTPHGVKPAGKKRGFGRLIGRTKGGMNTKLHAVTDADGRPLSFFMTAGQVSDHTGAAALLDDLPKAQWMLGDCGYDADWYRDALQAKGITPCIPGRKVTECTHQARAAATVHPLDGLQREGVVMKSGQPVWGPAFARMTAGDLSPP